MKRWQIGLIVAAIAAGATVAGISLTSPSELAAVRKATSAFANLDAAAAAGYAPLLDCFDNPSGGMGQHYVNEKLVADPAVNPLTPEALVYEVKGDQLKLVGVEYIRPQAAGGPPQLFGRTFGAVPALKLWALHAWVWRENPAGDFADYNRNVAACPSTRFGDQSSPEEGGSDALRSK